MSILTDDIRRGMDSGKLTGTAFIDLSNDTVDHGCILSKLKCYGIIDRQLS